MNPQAVDWNNDGYDDIIVGDAYGYINYFQRNSNGSLQAGVQLYSNGTKLDVGLHSSPDFVDWDNDGDLDMIVGKVSGQIWVYMNTGTASAYEFSGYTDFTAGGSAVSFSYSYPSIYDMNGDGLFDVVVGAGDKKYHYYENTGSLGNPSFAADSPLQYQNGTHAQTLYYGSRPEIANWNEDGCPDIISGMGASDDFVYLFMAIPPVSVEESTSGLIVPSTLSMNENPVRSSLSVSINLGEAVVSTITVYTMDGRVALTHATGLLNPGRNSVIIPNSLPNGTYVLHCSAGNIEITERFVVAR